MACSVRTRENDFKWKEGQFRLKEENFYSESKKWNRFSRGAVDILSEGVQGQIGWDFEQSGLVECVLVHGRGGRRSWSLRSLPTPNSLRFHDIFDFLTCHE